MQLSGFHPAPGMGVLVPGFYTAPSNPLRGDPVQPVTVAQSLSALLPSMNLLPYNPLEMTADGGLRHRGMAACGGCEGLGQDLSTELSSVWSSLSTSLSGTESTTGLPTWVLVAGGLGVLYLLMGRSNSEGYSKSVSQMRSRYPRRITKIGRAGRSAYRELTA